MLIAQRSATKKYNRNGWTTPAGHIEAGETPEEVALDVTILTKLGLDIKDSPDCANKKIHTHYFLCRTTSTDVALQEEELQTHEWLTLDAAIGDERLTTQVKDMCKKAQEFL